MTASQRGAIVAAPLVLLTMLPVYRLLGERLGPERGWYAGFVPYWAVWCLLVPLFLLGGRDLLALLGPAKMTPLCWILVAVPPFLALAGRLATGAGAPVPLLWMPTAVVNGTLEEVLWRGVYTRLFVERPAWAIAWPSVWFAAWHLAPGRLSMGGDAWLLALGALPFGLCLGWVAHRSGSIRWTVVSHVLAGLAMS